MARGGTPKRPYALPGGQQPIQLPDPAATDAVSPQDTVPSLADLSTLAPQFTNSFMGAIPYASPAGMLPDATQAPPVPQDAQFVPGVGDVPQPSLPSPLAQPKGVADLLKTQGVDSVDTTAPTHQIDPTFLSNVEQGLNSGDNLGQQARDLAAPNGWETAGGIIQGLFGGGILGRAGGVMSGIAGGNRMRDLSNFYQDNPTAPMTEQGVSQLLQHFGNVPAGHGGPGFTGVSTYGMPYTLGGAGGGGGGMNPTQMAKAGLYNAQTGLAGEKDIAGQTAAEHKFGTEEVTNEAGAAFAANPLGYNAQDWNAKTTQGWIDEKKQQIAGNPMAFNILVNQGELKQTDPEFKELQTFAAMQTADPKVRKLIAEAGTAEATTGKTYLEDSKALAEQFARYDPAALDKSTTMIDPQTKQKVYNPEVIQRLAAQNHVPESTVIDALRQAASLNKDVTQAQGLKGAQITGEQVGTGVKAMQINEMQARTALANQQLSDLVTGKVSDPAKKIQIYTLAQQEISNTIERVRAGVEKDMIDQFPGTMRIKETGQLMPGPGFTTDQIRQWENTELQTRMKQQGLDQTLRLLSAIRDQNLVPSPGAGGAAPAGGAPSGAPAGTPIPLARPGGGAPPPVLPQTQQVKWPPTLPVPPGVDPNTASQDTIRTAIADYNYQQQRKGQPLVPTPKTRAGGPAVNQAGQTFQVQLTPTLAFNLPTTQMFPTFDPDPAKAQMPLADILKRNNATVGQFTGLMKQIYSQNQAAFQRYASNPQQLGTTLGQLAVKAMEGEREQKQPGQALGSWDTPAASPAEQQRRWAAEPHATVPGLQDILDTYGDAFRGLNRGVIQPGVRALGRAFGQ